MKHYSKTRYFKRAADDLFWMKKVTRSPPLTLFTKNAVTIRGAMDLDLICSAWITRFDWLTSVHQPHDRNVVETMQCLEPSELYLSEGQKFSGQTAWGSDPWIKIHLKRKSHLCLTKLDLNLMSIKSWAILDSSGGRIWPTSCQLIIIGVRVKR